MSNTTIVTTARFEAEEVGVEKTAAALTKLSGEATKASAATDGFSRRTTAALAQFAREQKSAQAAMAKAIPADATKQIATITQQNARALSIVTKERDKLVASIDPAARSMMIFAQKQAQLNALVGAGAIGFDDYSRLMGQATERWGRYGKVANDAGDKVRLTSNQMQGLGFQINDIGTMLAMGSSPFQIMASQAGQVAQVLGDGPQGLKGSLAAIGSSIAGVARAIPTAGYAIAGVTAAVGALWYITKGPEAREVEVRLKDFESAIKRLEAGWKGAADAARDYANAPTKQALDPNAAFLDVRGSAKRLQTDLKAAIDDLNTSDLLSGRILRPFAGHVTEARREISALYADLRTGEMSAQQFADAMLRIRLDPNADDYARNFAEQIRLALPDVMALERQVQALNQATAKMAAPKGTMGRHDLPNEVFTDRFGPTIGGDNRFGSTEAMDSIREGLKSQREELEKTEDATRSYSDAVNQQRAALADSVAGLRLQVDMFGQTEGAIAAARFKMDAMAEAQRAATDAKQGSIDPALVQQISQEAAEYGRLTDQLRSVTEAQRESERAAQEAQQSRKRAADFEADLAFERSILTLPESEQQVRTALRGLDVDFNSFEGQRIAAAMRYNEELRSQQQELSRTGGIVEDMGDIFSDVFSSATRDGESFFDSILRGFAAAEGAISNSTPNFERAAA